MSSNIVITTFGTLGDLNPYIALAQGLKERGHNPVVASSEFFREFIENAGLEFRPIRPDIDPENTELARRAMDPKTGTEMVLKEILFPVIRDSYRDLSEATAGADMLVTHPLAFAGPLVAEKRQIPWVSTVLAPMSFFSAYDTPVLPPFPSLARLRLLGKVGSSLIIQFARFVARGWSEPVRQLRAEIGLPFGKDPIFEGQFSPELVLAMFSVVLAEPKPDWPANTQITGYCFYDVADVGERLSPEVDRFLDSASPFIVFTLGTSAVLSPGAFYQESIKAVNILGMRALLLVGRYPVYEPRPSLPEGVIVCDYAPFSEVFPRAAAVVHHGGIGTCGQALRSGRPMLIVPFAHDQPDNAFRLTRLGVARTLFPKRYTASRIARHLRTLLENPNYAARAKEVGRRIQSEDGVNVACDAIEKRLTASD
jgi:UDP:flavonoid glycosyltransferase YjiC (YdhE family)